MLALSIRQPYAELILRGIKTVEYRSRRTSIVGERFWIYASRKPAVGVRRWELGKEKKGWSTDLSGVAGEQPWVLELAQAMRLFSPHELPTGVIVGSARIERCEEIPHEAHGGTNVVRDPARLFKWYLADVERATRLHKPARHPQPVWFKPF